MLLMISTCTLQLMSRQNNIFKIASQGEGEGEFLTNNNLNQKKVYLTFDDGPSDHTAEILDILKKNKDRTCQKDVPENHFRRSYTRNAFLQP